MSETKGLTRQQMADRVALEFQDGWIVNLGVGIPTLCSNTHIGERDIIYHSENGVIGYGPIAPEGQDRSQESQRPNHQGTTRWRGATAESRWKELPGRFASRRSPTGRTGGRLI